MEGRTYPPHHHTPKGHRPMAVGRRFFLMLNGTIWGSARLKGVLETLPATPVLRPALQSCNPSNIDEDYHAILSSTLTLTYYGNPHAHRHPPLIHPHPKPHSHPHLPTDTTVTPPTARRRWWPSCCLTPSRSHDPYLRPHPHPRPPP